MKGRGDPMWIIIISIVALVVGAALLGLRYYYKKVFTGIDPTEDDRELYSSLQHWLLVGAIVALAAGLGLFIVGLVTGCTAAANAQQQGSQPEASVAESDFGYYLVETVNAVQVKEILGEGDITTSPEVHQDYVTKVTGYQDGYAAPYSSKNLDEVAASTETGDTIFNKATRKGNIHAAYGYVAAIIYAADLDLSKMPVLQRLMDIYPTQGAEAFYEHEGGQIKVSKTDDSFFYNEDGKLLLAIAYTLFSDGHLKFYGVEHHQTRVNWHSNAAMVDSDRRIELNPIQYEGDFYVWGYEWKGYAFEHFGTNCGADNGLGCGDKRPALFTYPVAEETATPSGGNPGTGGGQPPVTPDPSKPEPKPNPTKDEQPTPEAVKSSAEDPINTGAAPDARRNEGTTPLTDDSPAQATQPNPHAGNDDGMSDPSNQTQDPAAHQDENRPSVEQPIAGTGDDATGNNGQSTNVDQTKDGRVELDD